MASMIERLDALPSITLGYTNPEHLPASVARALDAVDSLSEAITALRKENWRLRHRLVEERAARVYAVQLLANCRERPAGAPALSPSKERLRIVREAQP